MSSGTPKGTLLLIGGAEDKGRNGHSPDLENKNKNFKYFDILSKLLPNKKRKKSRHRDHYIRL